MLNTGDPLQTTVPSLLDLPYRTLERVLIDGGVSPAHARPLWRSLYRLTPGEPFLPPLARWLAAGTHSAETLAPVETIRSADGLTRKFLLRLADGQTIETVLMAYPGRHTACLSTEAGCAMGCVFCATGQGGFARRLRPGEIVAQALHAQNALRDDGRVALRNLVLMGMGEPLHNYDHVITALDILTDDRGMNLAPGRVTISTVGVVPGIRRLADERQPYNLAVSLHGASDEERNALVPIGRRWPLAELMAACRDYGARTGRRIFFEWTLIAGANDSPATAARLAALLAGIDAHVNLIPLNRTAGFGGSAAEGGAADAFRAMLREAGLPCTIRQRRGIDVAAGCGQLRAAVA